MGISDLIRGNNNTERVSTNVFGLEQLFYLPLKAVIDANTQAAMAAVDIIRQYGFENDKSSDNYGKLKMVTFSYDFVNKNGQMQTMSVSIPFITLIPLPILEVKEADLSFSLKVIGQLDVSSEGEINREQSQNLLAIFSPNSNTNSGVLNLSVEANMDVNIKVGQSDLPAGILQLLNLGQEAVIGENLYQLNIHPSMLLFSSGEKLIVEVFFMIKEGLPKDIMFNVSVQPRVPFENAPFSEPIKTVLGNQIGIPSWKGTDVIPIYGDEFARFKLQFSAGDDYSNGFIVINSRYSNQEKLYYSIDPT